MNIIGHIDPSAFAARPRMHHGEPTAQFPSSVSSRAHRLLALRAQNWRASGSPTPPKPYDAEVEYLDFVVPSYIDTGLIMSDRRYEIDAQFLSGGGSSLGSLIGFNTDNTGLIRWRSSSMAECFWGTWKTVTNSPLSRHVYSAGHGYGFSVDGAFISDDTAPNFITRWTLKICAYNVNNTQRQGNCRVYSFNAIDGDATIMALIPVRKDGVGYMYDRVSGEMFGNSGAGAFVIGPDV